MDFDGSRARRPPALRSAAGLKALDAATQPRIF